MIHPILRACLMEILDTAGAEDYLSICMTVLDKHKADGGAYTLEYLHDLVKETKARGYEVSPFLEEFGK